MLFFKSELKSHGVFQSFELEKEILFTIFNQKKRKKLQKLAGEIPI